MKKIYPLVFDLESIINEFHPEVLHKRMFQLLQKNFNDLAPLLKLNPCSQLTRHMTRTNNDLQHQGDDLHLLAYTYHNLNVNI